MPIHGKRIHPWPYSEVRITPQYIKYKRNGYFNEDEQNRSDPSQLLALCAKIQKIRKETQKHLRPLVTMLQHQGRRYSHRWPMQTPQQDSQIQRPQSHSQ